ncbi:OmpA family protein [bacterium]|nr:OmpA family protein [bacterium]
MKKNSVILYFVFVAIIILKVFIPTNLDALEHQRYFLGLNGSTIKLIGDNVDFCAIRTWENACLGTYFSPKVGLELSAGYGMVVVRDWDNSSTLASYFKEYPNSTYRTYLYPIGMALHYNILPQSRWQPYVAVGGMLMFWELKEDVDGRVHRVSGLRANMMGTLGGGIEFMVNEDVGLEVGGRFHIFFTQDNDMSGYDDVQSAAIDFVRVGVNFYFGGTGEKVVIKEAEPIVVEKRDTLVIKEKETVMIPEADTDGDRIIDRLDNCPDEPETYNDYQDLDGCPDKKPEVIFEKEAPIILEGVTFETGSATLTSNAKKVLDQVVQTLKDYSEMKLEISGHTDNVGSKSANQKLSERRANSVKQYLVNNGIDSARLTTVGYGEDKPIDTNGTVAGRSRNRRIEFLRTE